MPDIPKITDPRQIARPKGVRIDPRLHGAMPGLVLSEETERELERLQKLVDGNLIAEITGAVFEDLEAEAARRRSEGETSEPNFTADFKSLAQERVQDALSDIPRGPSGLRLMSRDGQVRLKARLQETVSGLVETNLRVQGDAIKDRALENISAAGNELAAAARRHPHQLPRLLATVEGLISTYDGALKPFQEDDVRSYLGPDLIMSAIEGLAERGETDAARELISNAELKGLLSAEELRAFKQQAEARIEALTRDRETRAERAARELAARRQAERQRFVSQFSLRLEKGEASHEELARAEANRVIAPQEKVRLASLLEEHEERQRRKAEDITRVTEGSMRGEPLDPNDPDDRAAVEAHFESMSVSFAELPPEDRAVAEDAYVQQTGVVPAALRDTLFGGLLSDDPAAQVAAAQRLARLEETDPALVRDFPEAGRVRARALAAFSLPGLTPERIVELAEKRVQQSGADQTGLGGKAPAPEGVDETRQKAAEELGAELEVLERLEAEPPGEASAAQDQTVLVIRDRQTGETRNVTTDQLADLQSLADDQAATQEDPPDELVHQIGELVLSVLPVTGEAISARDAYLSFRAAQEALENDDLAGALLKGGETALNALGAIPVIGGAIRAPKAVAKAVPVLLKLFGRLTRRAGRTTPSIAILAGKTAPKLRLSRPLKKEFKGLIGERNRIKALREQAPIGSEQRAALLKQQQRVQLKINRRIGKAYQKQILDELERRGFTVVRGPRFRTAKGSRQPDYLTVGQKKKITSSVEVKSGEAKYRRPQSEKDRLIRDELGIGTLLIKEGKSIQLFPPGS